MKKLYIHIGTEKTGTTTIQETLFKNRGLIKKQGVLYPESLNHSNHVSFCLAFMDFNERSELYSVMGCEPNIAAAERFSKETLRNLEEEILRSGCDAVVISNEHLHSRITSREEISRIKDWAQKIFDDVEIVCYLRNQADLAISYYSTLIKSGNAPENIFPEFQSIPHYYDYKNLLDSWCSVFGGISVRVFSRELLVNGSVVDDVFSILGISECLKFVQHPPDANVSLDYCSLEILKGINRSVPFLRDGRLNRDRRNLIAFFEGCDSSGGFNVSFEDYQKFFEKFELDNEYLKNKYDVDFPVKPHIDGQTDNFGVSSVIDKFSEVWVKCARHINYIEERNILLRCEIAILKGDVQTAKSIYVESKQAGFELGSFEAVLASAGGR